MAQRYQCRESERIPQRFELIDKVANNFVAVIAEDETGRWQWKRYTSAMMHGAAPREGSSASLAHAKRKILENLPA